MIRTLTLAASLLSLAGCQSAKTETEMMAPAMVAPPVAADGLAASEPVTDFGGGTIIGVDGGEIGEVILQQGPKGMLITVALADSGLAPGWHGIHLHQVGDCSDVGEFKLSGGHLGMIPDGHGLMNAIGPEPGDLPNIYIDPNGMAGYQAFAHLVAFDMVMDEDGTALIIHANPDDHYSQPIGGAGPRVACAVLAAG